ncbi:hypothetical protein NDU88_002969 [Pleurodeles waltl]|uniref:Uncharacterized protein n=1 Tax=Pleurodeles waltl TaxID=8319 RepID=A0AAV7W4N9_PLEWA|nr:hypothetical protein NDU88_002969 [Pleurodeles waltl]
MGRRPSVSVRYRPIFETPIHCTRGRVSGPLLGHVGRPAPGGVWHYCLAWSGIGLEASCWAPEQRTQQSEPALSGGPSRAGGRPRETEDRGSPGDRRWTGRDSAGRSGRTNGVTAWWGTAADQRVEESVSL